MYSEWEFALIKDLARGWAVTSSSYQAAWDAAEAAYMAASSLPPSAQVQAVETLIKTANNNRIVAEMFAPRPYAPLVPYNSAVADAATLWQQYASAGEKISAITNGAQSTTAIAKTSGATSLAKTTSGTYKPAGLLALKLPTACAAIAPVLGVAVGFDLYNKNPQAWQTISERLLPFCYEGSTSIPTWAEAAEAAGEIVLNALVPASVIAALKGALTEAGILNASGTIAEITGYKYNGEFYPGTTGPTIIQAPWEGDGWYYRVDEGCVANVGEGYEEVWNLTSENQKGISLYRRNGTNAGNLTCGPNEYGTRINGHVSFYHYDDAPQSVKDSWDAFQNGTEEVAYPEGVNPWGETIYYPQPGPLPQVASGTDSIGNPTWEDAYPVPLPNPLSPEQSLTEPFPYPSESIDPVPWPQPQPSETFEPLRLPDPVIDQLPWPDTETDPWPEPEPDPYPQPRPDPSPENPTDPEPSGPDIAPPEPPPPSGGDTGPTPLGPDILPPFGDGQNPDGIIAVYNPPVNTLRSFAQWLWVTWPQAGLDKIWNNPFDGVISLFELYCTPPVIGSRNIRSGFLDSGINSPVIERYTTINCGSLIVPEYWNNYLDYAPYTQVSIYLPFIGIVNVDANDIVGHSVNITYNIDCYNGSCIAMITVAKAGPDGEVYNCLAYQYSGNCAVDVPLSGGSQAAIKGAIINATAVGIGGLIMGAASMKSGKLLSGASDVIQAAEHALSSVMSARSSVQKSGSFGASFGAMGAKRPYIMVKRPVQVVVRNYNELYGYQAHKAVTVGQCRGFIRCREVHVESATASDAEKNKIAQMLKDGVWI